MSDPRLKTADTLVNSTCSFNGAVPGASFFAGNAAFVTSDGKLTGFDFSGKIDIVQSWSVTFNQEDEFNTKLQQYIADRQALRVALIRDTVVTL